MLLWDFFKPSIRTFFDKKEKEMLTTYEEQVKHAKILIK